MGSGFPGGLLVRRLNLFTPRLAHLPVLIVWGDCDQAFKEPQRRRWERTFPNHRTVILQGASHYIQEDAPEEILAAISKWWPGE
jgi:haloalkane dehalogenase